MNEELRKEIIMEHYQNPINKYDTQDDSYSKINTKNGSCIDDLNIYIKIDNNVIKDITFNGEACAISISSTSIMIKNLIGKTLEEALVYIDNFENMVNEKEYDENLLNEGLAYCEIYKQNNRKNCATLPYRGIKKILLDYQK